MPETPPDAPEREDRRGTPAGQGTIVPAHGGRIGNPAHVPTDETRAKVRTLAKTMRHEMQMPKRWIAAQMGISVRTLDRHYEEDMIAGRAEVVATLGATLLGVALGTIKDISRERLDAIKFALPRIGHWSSKIEMSGPDGRPLETVDLSGMTPAALREYGRQAAIAKGLDPDETVGPPLNDDA